MEYYKITQDLKIKNVINISTSYLEEIESKDNNDENIPMIYQDISSDEDYLDYINVGRYVLVSDQLKKLFIKYETGIDCKRLFIVDLHKKKRKQYWIINVQAIACLSDRTQLNPDGTIKSIVIDEQFIKAQAIFSVSSVESKYVKKSVIINLDLAESILRRNIIGICYEKVACE